MATSSFNRDFIIKDKYIADRFLIDLKNPQTIKVKRCNLDIESKEALELLKKLYNSNKK